MKEWGEHITLKKDSIRKKLTPHQFARRQTGEGFLFYPQTLFKPYL